MSLCAANITYRHAGRTLLDDISLELHAGELLVVVGPNGAGKSTLLGALSGDLVPSCGRVTLAGRSLSDYPLDELAEYRAVVAAPPVLAFDYTVADVVSMGWLHGNTQGARVRADALASVLAQAELQHLKSRRYMTLSSGERQRVAFARAVLQLWRIDDDAAPRWLMLDEPTANLDVAHAVAMVSAFRDIARRGDGVLAILHDLDLAARFADRVALVVDGKLQAVGAPETVLRSDLLSSVYRAPIHVERHPALDRLVVIG